VGVAKDGSKTLVSLVLGGPQFANLQIWYTLRSSGFDLQFGRRKQGTRRGSEPAELNPKSNI
jgi:hypothetical protein